jgi:hypothetical protein
VNGGWIVVERSEYKGVKWYIEVVEVLMGEEWGNDTYTSRPRGTH